MKYLRCLLLLLCSCGLLILGFAYEVVAECGPWDGTPSCVRNSNHGVGSLTLNRFGEGYSVCYMGRDLVCRNSTWVAGWRSCSGKPDSPSPLRAGDVACSKSEGGNSTAGYPKQGLIQNIGKMGTPLGGTPGGVVYPTPQPAQTASPGAPDAGPYPPGCRNKVSFDACALNGRGCSAGNRVRCAPTCSGLCNDP